MTDTWTSDPVPRTLTQKAGRLRLGAPEATWLARWVWCPWAEAPWQATEAWGVGARGPRHQSLQAHVVVPWAQRRPHRGGSGGRCGPRLSLVEKPSAWGRVGAGKVWCWRHSPCRNPAPAWLLCSTRLGSRTEPSASTSQDLLASGSSDPSHNLYQSTSCTPHASRVTVGGWGAGCRTKAYWATGPKAVPTPGQEGPCPPGGPRTSSGSAALLAKVPQVVGFRPCHHWVMGTAGHWEQGGGVRGQRSE